jgi:hypothetical protein
MQVVPSLLACLLHGTLSPAVCAACCCCCFSCYLLPATNLHADYDRLNNTNALIAGLWPSVSEAVSQQLVLAMAPGLMQQAAKDYGAGYLTDLKLVEFELGEVSQERPLLSVTCTKWYFK